MRELNTLLGANGLPDVSVIDLRNRSGQDCGPTDAPVIC
jgi:hypothetical protein